MWKYIFLFMVPLAASAAPLKCHAIASGNWNTPSIWANAANGAGGTCTAAGGSGIPIIGQTAAIQAGVPGARTAYSVTGASWASNTATITTSTGTFAAGEVVHIAGIGPSGFNTAYAVLTGGGPGTLSFALSANPGAYSSGGTVSMSNMDRAIINSGVTVHVTSGLGVDLGEPAEVSTFQTGLTINTTSCTTSCTSFGAVVVDQAGLVEVNATVNSTEDYASIAPGSVLQVMPGGSLWIGSALYGGQISVSGRFYIGCGDQTAYPTPFCTGTAGSWVTPSIAGALNFTAAALPAGLAPGDLVELSPIPQPLTFPYPYNIDGVTPPPAPPILPQTNDAGTSPMRACGAASTCLVPADQPLCVVAVSGNAVSLGWPQGGTPAQPYCTGAETAMAITNAGSGQLWMKKPAFFWSDPNKYNWNNPHTITYTNAPTQMDATRSGIYSTALSTGSNNYAPVSNAAGTGPGRPGDHSISAGTNNWGEPCGFLSIDQVTSSGCWQDYDSGAMVAHGYLASLTGSLTFTAPSAMVGVVGGVSIPSGTRPYNEMVFANADLRYIHPGASSTGSASGVIRFSTLSNTANNKMGFLNNTVKMSRSAVGIDGVSLSASTPLQINGNSFGAAENDVKPNIVFAVSSSYVDISNNYLKDYSPLFECYLNSSMGTTRQTFDHVTDVNNFVIGTYYVGGDTYYTCNWTNRWSADNRINSIGSGQLFNGYAFAFGFNNSYAGSPTNAFYRNYIYGNLRAAQISGGGHWYGNYAAFNWHHVLVMQSYDSLTISPAGGYLSSIKVDHNILASASNEGPFMCINSGYNGYSFIDGLEFSNNTCLTASPFANSGNFQLGDFDAQSATAIAGLKVYGNIFGAGAGFIKSATGPPNFEQTQMVYGGWNSAQGTSPMYTGFSTNPNNIPNPEMFRTAYATESGQNYNTSTIRNITGVAIQNPRYTTATTGCLLYSYTSQSSITMQWSIDPACANGISGFGTAVQLNWSGAGTTYTMSGNPAAANASAMTAAFSGTPFTGNPPNTANGGIVPAGCPLDRWAWATNGTEAAHAYVITSCPGTYNSASSQLGLAPQDLALGTATLAVIKFEIRLYDAGGSNSIDLAIDARSLPHPASAATLLDAGITLTPEDYCGAASGCAQAPAISGMPTTIAAGSSPLPLVPVAMPILGGSAEQAFCTGNAACGGTSYYVPSGSAYQTAGPNGSYIGAVSGPSTGPPPPPPPPPAPTPGHLCVSQPSGSYNWSDPTAWTNCGGSYPNDLDYAVWKSTGTLTIDINVGTTVAGVNWIRQENGTVSINPGVTIRFNSTGTNPIGSGTAGNPGGDATMSGFFLAAGTAFNINGTVSSRVTITSANGTGPIYIHHSFSDYTGCNTLTANICNGAAQHVGNPAMNFSYVDFYNLGANVSGFYGIVMGGSAAAYAGLTITQSRFYSPYEILSSFTSATRPVVFQFNTVYYPQAPYSLYVDVDTLTNASITDNTEIVGATGVTGTFCRFLYGPKGLDFERNAEYSTAAAGRTVVSMSNFVGSSDTGNILKNNLEVFPEPAVGGPPCSGVSAIDSATVFTGNVCQGGAASQLYNTAAGAILTVNNNWRSQWKESFNSQGNFITYGAVGGVYIIRDNLLIGENASSTQYPMALLAYTSASTNFNRVNVDHNTVIEPTVNGGPGLFMGEGTTFGAVVSSTVRSNIVYGGASQQGAQITSGNVDSLSSMAPVCAVAGVGVCNNLTYNAGQQGMYHAASPTAGWDDGAHTHPNAVYGDLTANPSFVDATRRPCGFDTLLGGPGTCDDLFARLATRALGAHGCSVCGTYTDGAYGAIQDNLIEAMRKWLFHGAIPQNQQTWCAGHDGETLGAVPFCAQSKTTMGATAF